MRWTEDIKRWTGSVEMPVIPWGMAEMVGETYIVVNDDELYGNESGRC